MIAEPIHVVEQDESCDLSLVSLQKSLDGVGMHIQSIEQTASKLFVVGLFDVFGCAGRGVGAGDVHAPEVVVLDRNFGKDGFERILDEPDNTAGVLLIDLTSLRLGNAEHAEGGIPVHGKLQRLGPNLVTDSVIDLLLILQGGRVENLNDFFAAASHFVDIRSYHPRKRTGGSAEVERFLGMVEEADPSIPVFLRDGTQRLPQAGRVDRLHIGKPSFAEHFVEPLVIEVPNGGGLQFEQRVLPRIHIHGMDLSCTGEQVIEGIAACGGDHQHFVLLGQVQCLAVEPGVFPASVVNKIVTVDESKDSSANPFADGHTREVCF